MSSALCSLHCLPASVLRTLGPDLRPLCSDFSLIHPPSRGTILKEPHDPTHLILVLLSSTCLCIELAEDGASRYGAWALHSLSESLFSDYFGAFEDGTSACVVPVALTRYFARDWNRSGRGPSSR